MDKFSPNLLAISREAGNHEVFLLRKEGIEVSVRATEGYSTSHPDSLRGQGGERALQTRERVRASGTPDGAQTWKPSSAPPLDWGFRLCPSINSQFFTLDGIAPKDWSTLDPFHAFIGRP